MSLFDPRLPGPESGRLARSCAFALLSSALLWLASPASFSLPLLAWLALVPLFLRLRHHSPRQAALIGLVCGFAWHLPLLTWIIIVLSTYGEVALAVSLLALFLLALYMGSYAAVFAFLCAKSGGRVPLLVSAPVLWVALDFLRAHLFTGFPWLDLAYTQYSLPLPIQVADLAGHHGVTFLIILVNALLATLLAGKKQADTAPSPSLRRPPRPCPPSLLAGACLLTALAAAYSGWRLHGVTASLDSAEKIRVAVAQGNFPQNQKWLPEFQQETVDTYLRLSEEAIAGQKAQLVIWPETALPFYPYEHPLFPRLHGELTRPRQLALLTGTPHRERTHPDGPVRYFNSAFLIEPDGMVSGRYDKQHLVPFGEYIPFRRLLHFASPLVETMGDFTPGRSSQPLSCQNGRIGVLICFESIFPEISRQQVRNGANLLVNITNDAWFGRSRAPWQHLSMAPLRAVENRRSLVRAANTGISAFIDPSGRVREASPLFAHYAGSASVALLNEQTVYSRWGHVFPTACFLLALAGLWRCRRD